MRNETAIAPTRDLFPEAEVCTTVETQATISEAILQLANSTKIALVTIQLRYEWEERTGQAPTAPLTERAGKSIVYLLQNIRALVRKTDLVFLHHNRVHFVLREANQEGAAIVEERLWEALLWRVHNMNEHEMPRPTYITIGHGAYPDPHADLNELFEAAGQMSKHFNKPTPIRHAGHAARLDESAQSDGREELPLLARKLGIPYLSLLPRTLPQSVLQVVNSRLAQELHCYPIGRDRNILTVAMLNPQDRVTLERLRRETGLRIFPVLTHPEALEKALEQLS